MAAVRATKEVKPMPVFTGFMLFCARRLESAALSEIPEDDALARGEHLLRGWNALSERGRAIFERKASELAGGG